jgi:hypothetical protein
MNSGESRHLEQDLFDEGIMFVRPFQSPAVAAAYDGYPDEVRAQLLTLRAMIYDVAASTAGVGTIHETLKWREPAYVTVRPKSGSTIRVAWKKSAPSQYAMYFICTTDLVDRFRTWFSNDLTFEGNRAIIFKIGEVVPVDAVRYCIAAALTYHQRS